ncbi:hypothetical protein L6R46_03485 [Myxococcota bacterium]|jgi:hypothetical protein|nr:hypothetical protein [Myxococcota bacterium]
MRPTPKLLPLALLLACAEDTPPGDPCLPGEAPTLRLGTGELAYEALPEEGARFEIIHGPQGGVHALIGLAATYADASDLWTAQLTGRIDGAVAAEAFPYLEARCNGAAGELQTWGTLLVWELSPEALDGATAEIDATVTDAAGTTLSASITATLFDPTLE